MADLQDPIAIERSTMQAIADAVRARAAQGGGSVIYSTEERRIGTWIDGKPLYQKTVQVTMPTVGQDGVQSVKDIALPSLGIENAGFCFVAEGTCVWKNVDNATQLNDAWNDAGTGTARHLRALIINGSLQLITNRSGASEAGAIITLRYTKSTDTA